MGSHIWASIGIIILDLSDLEMSVSNSLKMLISRKRGELGHTLLLNTDRNSYMGNACHHQI